MHRLHYILIGITLISSTTIAKTPLTNKTDRTKNNNETWYKPFDIHATQLPPHYEGLILKKFMKDFEKNINSQYKKGEFETSIEYEKRIADSDSLLSPLNTKDLYAFRMKNIILKYNADIQAYVSNNQYYCHYKKGLGEYGNKNEFKYVDNRNNWRICKVATIDQSSRDYKGSNAYGTTLTVTRISENNFILGITNQNQLLDTIFEKNNSSDFTETTHALLSEYYNQLRTIKSKYNSKWDIPELSELPTKLRDDYNPKFLGSVSIPLEQARLLQGKTITILFIGRIPDAKIIRDFSSSEATIKSPIEFYSSSKGLPFEVHRIIYYVLETGEILGSVDIPYDSIDTLINQ